MSGGRQTSGIHRGVGYDLAVPRVWYFETVFLGVLVTVKVRYKHDSIEL